MKRSAHFLSRRAVLIAVLLLVPAGARVCVSQDAPFSRLSLSLNVSQDFNRAEFQNDWDTTPAIDIAAGMPFYFGEVRGSVRLMRAHSTELTDISSAYINVGWGPTIKVGARSSILAFVSAGTMYMSFADETVSFKKSESELAVGLRAGFSTHLGGPLHAEVFTEWQHAFTSVPLDFVFISAGLKYDLVAPNWLRNFLD